MAMMWSPSTTLPVGVDGDDAVGVTVEGQADVGAALATTACCSGAGWVDPQRSLMLVPSGSAWMTVDVGAERGEHVRADRRARRRWRSRARRAARRAARPSRAATRWST